MILFNDLSFLWPFVHTLTGDAGAIEGFIHPLLGLEHLLAMFAVGLLSARLGGQAIWKIPVAFVTVMALGGIAGFIGGTLSIVSYGIAISVLLLGLALTVVRPLPQNFALALVAIFALFHGYAHGEAVPGEQTVFFFLAYVFGFLMATAGLHVIGALIGFIALRSKRGAMLLRLSGVAIAVVGAIFIANAANV